MAEPIEQIVTLPDEVPDVCAHLRTAGRFGFDTEFVGEDTYQPTICLIQVATEERLILIDPFTTGPLDEFWNLIVDPHVEVVAHAAREEIRLCKHFTGKRATNVFDLQIAAGLAGLNYPLGHAALVSHLLGVRLNKTETLTEWRGRPLTPQQIQYAYDDVRYLLPLANQLRHRLEKMDRLAWVHEEVERLSLVVTTEESQLERWRKLKGIGALTRKQLAIVREIHQWREAAAARMNRPARICCRDDLIIEIARRHPSHEKDLKVIRGLNKIDWPGLLAAVERGRKLPPEECPTLIEREQDPPRVQMLTSLLSAVTANLSASMQLAAGLICTTSDLRSLVRKSMWPKSTVPPSLLDEGWRREQIRPILERILRGETTLRVVALASDSPLELSHRDKILDS